MFYSVPTHFAARILCWFCVQKLKYLSFCIKQYFWGGQRSSLTGKLPEWPRRRLWRVNTDRDCGRSEVPSHSAALSANQSRPCCPGKVGRPPPTGRLPCWNHKRPAGRRCDLWGQKREAAVVSLLSDNSLSSSPTLAPVPAHRSRPHPTRRHSHPCGHTSGGTGYSGHRDTSNLWLQDKYLAPPHLKQTNRVSD